MAKELWKGNEAVAEADTSRAESETVADQTDTDVGGGVDMDESEATE